MGDVLGVLGDASRCAVRVTRLLVAGDLHLRGARVGSRVQLPDGRAYTVFRESTRDGSASGESVTLAVWFHLRGVPPGGRLRRWLFERLCIVNTVLFAGFDGYVVKLWMVDPQSADYAGLYSWGSSDEAERYAAYITAILRPLSVPGTVGYQILRDRSLEDHLRESSAPP